ncbi:MAG TPA: amino acid decarboxylase [Lactobacillus sp.]|nr:amino acid decarboxylase [Lactobacillus sp.]
MTTQTFQTTQQGYTIQAAVTTIGPDILIVVTGGDHPHIGDVTTLTATTGLQTIKYPSHDGRFHKDNIVGEQLAQQIQSVLRGSCTITSGIHVDHISQAQIDAAVPMGRKLGVQIKQWLHDQPFSISAPVYYSDQERPK